LEIVAIGTGRNGRRSLAFVNLKGSGGSFAQRFQKGRGDEMALRDFLFKSDLTKAPAKPTVVVQAAPPPTPVTTPPPDSVLSSPTSYTSSPEYKELYDKTDWQKTTVGAMVQKYLEPLSSLALDEHNKLKVALAQAHAQDGLTPEKFLAVFDGLEHAVQSEVAAFKASAQKFTEQEVTARKNQIDKLTAQLNDLQQQLAKLATEKDAAVQKISHACLSFQTAADNRSVELKELKARYTALLQG
jgi:hypothetical protein